MTTVILNGDLHQGSKDAAGYDLIAQHRACLPPGERCLVQTGVKLQMPNTMAALVVPRSGLALKKGVTVLNAPGLIDPDYTGEVGVILVNHSDRFVDIDAGDRIAQLVFIDVVRPTFAAGQLEETARGAGGFGSTGAA